MKKLFYILGLFAGMANAQIVPIPDANFKAKLIALGIDTSNDGNIQESEALVVTELNVSNSEISDLTGFEYFLNVRSLNCSNNQLTELNLEGFTQFSALDCSNNLIESLNVDGINFEIVLRATANSLTSLSMNNTTAMQVYCDENNLQTLDVSTATINQLFCNNNLLTSITMSNSSISFELHCENNQLTFLSPNTRIGLMFCGNNLFTALDFSEWTGLTMVNCTNSPLLTSLNVKNGKSELLSFDTNLNLEFVCVDESQLETIQMMVGNSGIIVSTYCSLTPGGNYNTATGIVRFDANDNGCDNADAPMRLLNLGITVNNQPTALGSVFTNNSGNYVLYMSQAGSYSLTPNFENPNYFSFTSTAIDATTINNTATVHNICILPNGVHRDVEVVVAPIGRARPGFEAAYLLVYKNKGNQTLSGTVRLDYQESIMDFFESDMEPSNVSPGSLTFSYSNLRPFENRSVYITFNVNAPTDIPAVNIDDQLDFAAFITPVMGDDQPSDNEFQLKQLVVGAFDPNEVICLEGDVVSPSEIGNYLHYMINFENTGNAEAENIVVRNVIDQNKFDVNSLQLLNSSAQVRAMLTGNVAEFIFPNINLHSGGHGNILLKVRSRNSLVEGDRVSKSANIYFDYNFPVQTNPAETVFQSLGNPDIPVDASISVYPNPTQGNLNIKCDNTIKSIELFDVQGRLLQTNLVNENQTSIDMSSHSSGIYFVRVISDKGMNVQKIVRV